MCLFILTGFGQMVHSSQETSTVKRAVAKLLMTCARERGTVPSKLFLTGVERQGVNPIGGGGFSDVWKGSFDGKLVAVKVLRLDFANDEEFIRRFHREAQSATSLAHPNIVSIYDVGEEECGGSNAGVASPEEERGSEFVGVATTELGRECRLAHSCGTDEEADWLRTCLPFLKSLPNGRTSSGEVGTLIRIACGFVSSSIRMRDGLDDLPFIFDGPEVGCPDAHRGTALISTRFPLDPQRPLGEDVDPTAGDASRGYRTKEIP